MGRQEVIQVLLFPESEVMTMKEGIAARLISAKFPVLS